jgi:hypothetical protein
MEDNSGTEIVTASEEWIAADTAVKNAQTFLDSI